MPSLLDTLERKFSWLGIPNLTAILVLGQLGGFALQRLRPDLAELLPLIPAKVAEGECWRLLTYLFISRPGAPICLFFALYLFYLMGVALERYWGTFRFNIYVGISAAATSASSFLSPDSVTYSEMIAGSVFLAFAWLVPEFRVAIFFLVPIPIKFLALLTWIGYFVVLIQGDWPERVAVVASLSNFLLFFAGPIWNRIVFHKRRMAIESALAPRRGEVRHRCAVCGITNRDDKELEFRYCSACKVPTAYCPAHLHDHAH